MKSVLAAALAAALPLSLAASSSHTLSLVEPRDRPARVVGLPLQRRPVSTSPVQRDRLRRLRRRGAVQASLDNEETLYFVNATLGTPAQSLRLHIDTGSSDLWVNTPSSALCSASSAPCAASGTYSANASSTYEYVGSYFNISYVDGSGAGGDYVSDTFVIGGTTLERLQFGIGYTSSSAQGILGIGYPVNEVQVNRAGKAAYKNLPAQLVADGTIASSAYSLWLNDLDASTGSILFGGVDSSQFAGTLQTVPIQKQAGVFSEFLITLTALTLGNSTLAQDLALAVLLDSGSSLTYLPDSIVQAIYDTVGATYDSSEGAAFVPCALADETDTYLSFTFSTPTIRVAMDELVLDLVTASGKRPTFRDGRTACLFGIAPAGSSTNVLGDTFLRSAYVVYDLDNNQIALAQTVFNATDPAASHVLEITADAIPDATAVASPVAATQGLTLGSSSSSSGSTSSSSSSASNKSSAAATLASRYTSVPLALFCGVSVLYALF